MMKKNRARKRAITIFLPFRLLCFAAAASFSSTRDDGSAAAAALLIASSRRSSPSASSSKGILTRGIVASAVVAAIITPLSAGSLSHVRRDRGVGRVPLADRHAQLLVRP